MPSSLTAWAWLIVFVIAAYFVWVHFAKPNLPGA